MAQVKIYGRSDMLPAWRAALSDAIHAAVMSALAYPPEKRFHRFIQLAPEDFIYPDDRSERYVIVEISMFEGRTAAAKKQLIRELFERIAGATDITPQDIEITISETPRANWGIRGVPGDELGLNYKVDV